MTIYLIPIRERRITILRLEANSPEEALRVYEAGSPDEFQMDSRTYDVNRLDEPVDMTGKSSRDEAFAMANLLMDNPEGKPSAEPDLVEHEYAFDIDLSAAVRITATSEKEARAKLRGFFDCADCNAGMLDDKPVTFEASLIEGRASLYEVDGRETRKHECAEPDGDDAMRNRIDRELTEGR